MDKVAEKGVRKLHLLDARNVPFVKLQNVCSLKRKIATRTRRIIAKCLYFEKKDRYKDAQDWLRQRFFLAMLKNNDPDLTTSVEYRGLGFSRLQVTASAKRSKSM